MTTKVVRRAPREGRLSPGDTIEYGLSAPVSGQDGAPWVKVTYTLAAREGESEEDLTERVAGLVHEFWEAQAEGLME